MNYKSTAYASYDGMKLSGYLWLPVENPKAIINLVHGYGEYSERYDYWAMKFTEKGFIVHAIDYRGHGKSDGRRGQLGKFEDYLKDIDVLVNESKKLFTDLPQIIYGHSLGGNIVTNYILKRDVDFKAAILSSPWYKLSFTPSAFMLFLARIMNKLYPKFTQKATLEIKALTHDLDIVEKYVSDPLVHEKISARMYFEIYKAGLWALENPEKLKTAVYIQHGTGDKITSYHASKKFYEDSKKLFKDIEYKEWEGLYHELHNELEKDDIFNAIDSWIQNKLKS